MLMYRMHETNKQTNKNNVATAKGVLSHEVKYIHSPAEVECLPWLAHSSRALEPIPASTSFRRQRRSFVVEEWGGDEGRNAGVAVMKKMLMKLRVCW